MLTSVAQASALTILTLIFEHQTLQNVWQPFDEYQEAYKANISSSAILANSSTFNTTALTNTTSVANTTRFSNTFASDAPEAFWTSQAPKNIFIVSLTMTLRYWWMIWLERILPARPRPSAPASIPEKTGDDDSREEEIVRKWIQSGRVQRASLSWFNTLAKWMLDLTVWNLAYNVLRMVVDPSLEGKWFWKTFNKWELLFHFGTGFFGVAPLATVISFILFPAHQRIVFEAGVNLAWKAFFAAFIRLMVPWAAEREFVRQVLRNISEDGLSNADSGRLASLGGDEL